MQQWIVEIAYDSRAGARKVSETIYLPSESDVRDAVTKKGGHVLSIRPHNRTPLERLLGRSSWWQIQLLRGIMFRSTSTSPGVALWKIIEAEENPTRQNILSPARETLARGLGVIDALKSLNVFDRSTIAILSASERANRLHEGIPYAIHSISQKRKNTAAILGTMGWLAFDVITIVQSLFWGKDMVLGWFADNAPKEGKDAEKYARVVSNLGLTWDILIYGAFAMAGFMVWCMLSYFLNKGKRDWPTARIVRRIPLIAAYLRDLSFTDSMSAAARMLRSNVSINDTLRQSAEASNSPEVARYWDESMVQLGRGVNLGVALDRPPLTRSERMELAGLSDLGQVATIMESISEMRGQAARVKHKLIVWLAFLLTGVYLAIAFGSAIYALTVMNMSMDSMMSGLTEGQM
jgi:type II secretory pathway component PulF